MIDWKWQTYSQLNCDELYEFLQIRQKVFCVEQNCAYQDVDELDKMAWHLSGRLKDNNEDSTLVAYCRVIYPECKYSEPSIGRVLTNQQYRSSGYGKHLLTMAIQLTTKAYPGLDIRISAQLYLQKFYSQAGFIKVSEPYLEDSIPHIEMLKPADP